jgi:excisionase family DNA binding protein
MSDNVIPFPSVPDPFDGDPFTEAQYDGPAVRIRPNATIYTLNEVAYLLDIPRRDVEEELIEGVIPGTPIGDDWLIDRTRYETWLDGLAAEGGQ